MPIFGEILAVLLMSPALLRIFASQGWVLKSLNYNQSDPAKHPLRNHASAARRMLLVYSKPQFCLSELRPEMTRQGVKYCSLAEWELWLCQVIRFATQNQRMPGFTIIHGRNCVQYGTGHPNHSYLTNITYMLCAGQDAPSRRLCGRKP
jgi:hypothetical protein